VVRLGGIRWHHVFGLQHREYFSRTRFQVDGLCSTLVLNWGQFCQRSYPRESINPRGSYAENNYRICGCKSYAKGFQWKSRSPFSYWKWSSDLRQLESRSNSNWITEFSCSKRYRSESRQKCSYQNWQGAAEKPKREGNIRCMEAEGSPRERPENSETGNPHSNALQSRGISGLARLGSYVSGIPSCRSFAICVSRLCRLSARHVCAM